MQRWDRIWLVEAALRGLARERLGQGHQAPTWNSYRGRLVIQGGSANPEWADPVSCISGPAPAKAEVTFRPAVGRGPERRACSTAAAALLRLALVLLGWGFVMTQPLQAGEDACLGHLALETPQGGFDPFVLADGDLGHKNSCAEANSLQSYQVGVISSAAGCLRLAAGASRSAAV